LCMHGFDVQKIYKEQLRISGHSLKTTYSKLTGTTIRELKILISVKK